MICPTGRFSGSMVGNLVAFSGRVSGRSVAAIFHVFGSRTTRLELRRSQCLVLISGRAVLEAELVGHEQTFGRHPVTCICALDLHLSCRLCVLDQE